MHSQISKDLELFCSSGRRGVVPVPVLIKGRLVFPPSLRFEQLVTAEKQAAVSPAVSSTSESRAFQVAGARVIRQPLLHRATLRPTGENQYLVFANPDPRELLESDIPALARQLFTLPFREVMEYVGQLRQVLTENRDIIRHAAAQTNATSLLDDRLIDLVFDLIPALLDPAGLGEMVDRELGSLSVPGRRYLDEWVEVEAESHVGVTARLAEGIFARKEKPASPFRHRLRAIPTRQLHITAGNSPLVLLLSFLRGLSTKSAMVIKSPAQATAVAAILCMAMRQVDPDHPITRHTSMVYWKGGDRSIEDVLFAPNAFDRLIVWGDSDTVQSVKSRAPYTQTIFLNPRYGLSLIGHEAFPDQIRDVAVRACTDSMIANQSACMSSLVHYVEATEDQALAYCRALKDALARWDEQLPHRPPRATLGQIRLLRRTAFLRGTWFVNGTPPEVSSAVVYMPEPFDLSVHPMSRFIVVRRLDGLDQILPFLSSSVSTLGVYPAQAVAPLRDAIAAAGVSNILPLGECERVYAGMPHDGMRILGALVNWTNG